MQATQEKLIHVLFDEIWNQKKLDQMPEVFDQNCEVHAGKETYQGIEWLKETIAHWQSAFPDITHQIDQVISTEDFVTVQWHGWGTHLGIFGGMLPTKKKVNYHGITIFKHVNGKFKEIWIASDTQGIISPLKSFSDKVYTEEDFCEDFNGPAAKIYSFWIKSRDNFYCGRQIGANAMRELFSMIPADGKPALEIPPEIMENVDVKEIQIPTRDGEVHARVYLPLGYEARKCPMMLYFHGGGWTTGSSESTELITRKFSHMAQMIVISVDYRLAPEYPFPHGLNDCIDAYKWARENGKKHFSANQERIVVAGDSCGGNLAPAIVISMRKQGYRIPDACLMLCPLTDFVTEKYPSTFSRGYKGLCYDYPFLCLVRANYARFDQLTLPEVSPMYDELNEFCPTFVLTAGYDPLYDENFAFVQKMRDAGNHVEHFVHEEMPHAYYYFLGLTKEEDEAYQKMCGFLRKFLLS